MHSPASSPWTMRSAAFGGLATALIAACAAEPGPAASDDDEQNSPPPDTVTGGGDAMPGGVDVASNGGAGGASAMDGAGGIGGAGGGVEAAPCCTLSETPGCSEAPDVEACVCALDSYCCSNAWDGYCLDIVEESCGVVCPEIPPDNTEPCCEPHATTGCVDPAIAACVCATNDFCCDTEWMEICVLQVDLLGCGTCE